VKNELIIIGCGGHARSIADVYLSDHFDGSIAFIDQNAKINETLFGFPIFKDLVSDKSKERIIIGLGDNEIRKNIFLSIPKERLINVISSKSYISPHLNQIGIGVFIGNFCHIGPMVSIGNNSIINTGSIIEHEVKIGSNCHIAPNVTISGRTTIGDQVFIGVGSTIIDKLSVCDQVIIGAGSVVVSNITIPGTYIGCPAKLVVK